LDFDRIDLQSDFGESLGRFRAPMFDDVVNSLRGRQLKLTEEFLVVQTLIPKESNKTRNGI
jgi:hypothetical protein